MQVRMGTFEITEQDRRAIRFQNDKRKTMCTRNEAKDWIQSHVDKALADLRYRWSGPRVSEAVANGADPDAVATHAAQSAPAPAPVSAPSANGVNAPETVNA